MAVRRVRRIVRKIDPWTVLKVSLVLNAIGALIFVLGTWVVWSMSLQRGIPDRFVEIFESLTLTFTPDGELYFRVIVMLAIVGGIVMTGLMTLGAVMYNLISDMVGGIEITVLEETYNPIPVPAPVRVAPAAHGPPASGNGAGTSSSSADGESPVAVPQAKSG